MGKARNRWIEIAEARRNGDTALFWNRLMSSIGGALIALIVLAGAIIYLVCILHG